MGQLTSPLLTLPFFLVVTPYAAHRLLRQRWLPLWLWFSIVTLVLMLPPLYFPASDQGMDLVVKGTTPHTLLKVLAICSLPRDLTSTWSIKEMFEFMLTGRIRRLQKTKEAPKPVNTKYTYYELLAWCPVHYFFFCLTHAYFKKYPYEYTGNLLLSPLDFPQVASHLVFVTMLYCNMSWVNAWRIIPMHIFNDPLKYTFNHIYKSTSIRDFWSHRWNMRVKDSLHQSVFLPVLHTLTSLSPPTHPEKDHKKYSTSHLRIASFASFIVSAIYHELIVLLMMPTEPLGTNTLFFLINGVLFMLQIQVQKVTGFGITWGTGAFWNVVGWAVTCTILLVLSPMFAIPYLRSGVFMDGVPVPPVLINWFMTVL